MLPRLELGPIELTPKYRGLVFEARHQKRVHRLRSAAEMEAFLNGVKAETQRVESAPGSSSVGLITSPEATRENPVEP